MLVETQGLYFKGSIRDAAFQEAALPLEYYRVYNTSVHQPQRFFYGLSDLDVEDFIMCNDSTSYGDDFTNAALWANYLKWTGDTEGVTATSKGYVAKCPDGRFWLSPACRSTPSLCIPVLSAYGTLQNFVQWATFHNLPFAIGRPPSSQKFQELVRKYDLLHYWWEPDEGEFIDLDISQLVFPPHNALEYQNGLFRTAGTGINLRKYGSALLAQFAPSARGLVQGIATSEDDILKLTTSIDFPGFRLSEKFFESQDEARAQMCAWAKANRDVWEPWLPIETSCIVGFGMVNSQDEPAAWTQFHVRYVRCCIRNRVCVVGLASRSLAAYRTMQYLVKVKLLQADFII